MSRQHQRYLVCGSLHVRESVDRNKARRRRKGHGQLAGRRGGVQRAGPWGWAGPASLPAWLTCVALDQSSSLRAFSSLGMKWTNYTCLRGCTQAWRGQVPAPCRGGHALLSLCWGPLLGFQLTWIKCLLWARNWAGGRTSDWKKRTLWGPRALYGNRVPQGRR